MPRVLGSLPLDLYRFARTAYAKAFSISIAPAFARFGRRSVIEPPLRVDGERRIVVGDDVYIGANSWLQTLPPEEDVAIEIGDGTSIAGNCVISAARSIVLGRKVLVARGVYISDHVHAFDDPGAAILDQGIDGIAPVSIGDGAWLGENVVVTPGVAIGRGAVIGANAVVLEDVPDRAVAVGVPARVVRTLAPVR